MATVYGVNATKTVAKTPLNVSDNHGRVRSSYDSYTSTAAIPINTIINLMKLPAGARVVGVQFSSTDQGTVGTLTVGWAATADEVADPDGFFTTINVNTAAITKDLGAVTPATPGLFKKFSAEAQITVTATQATDVAGTTEVAVFYVLD